MSRIVVIDDDPQNREILKTRLEQAGHEVFEAEDGEQGLQVCQTVRPAMVFLDLMMPKIDGWQVCRRLKSDAQTKEIPVVMLTACSQDIEQLRGWESGADEYVVKPWNPAQIQKLTEAYCHDAPANASH